jgi:hypothetical protein
MQALLGDYQTVLSGPSYQKPSNHFSISASKSFLRSPQITVKKKSKGVSIKKVLSASRILVIPGATTRSEGQHAFNCLLRAAAGYADTANFK